MHSRFLIRLVALAALGSATPVFAAEPPKPAKGAPSAAPKPKERADELFEQATAALDAGRLADAERLLQEAWSLKQTHDIAGNLGLVQVKLGKLPEGAQHLAWALDHFPPTEADAARHALEQELAKARAQVGAVRIHVNVAGADVAVNGKPVSAVALAADVFVAPGAVTLSASREGYTPVSQSVTIAAGAETRPVTLTLLPVGEPPRPRSIVPGVVIGGGAVAGAAVVTGVVLLGATAAKGSTVGSLQAQIKQEGGCASATAGGTCASLRSAGSTKEALGTAGLWTLVAGAGVGAATLVYALVGGPKAPAPKSGWRVLPAAAPGGGGLVVRGTF